MKRIEIRALTLLIFMTIAFSSCKKSSTNKCDEHSVSACSENPDKTNLRIKNISKYNFCNVAVNPSSGTINCGNLNKGDVTCYRSFDLVYNYAYIQLFIGEKEFKIQPIDYVGETPLGVGQFTYLLDIPDYNSDQISITVQRD